MKKTLILSLILAPLFSFAALTPCAPGDKFNLYTGKACVVGTTNTIDTTSYIASLIAEINSLKAQIASLTAGSSVPVGATASTLTPACQVLKNNYDISNAAVQDAVLTSQKIYQNLAGKDAEIAQNKIYRAGIESNLTGIMEVAKQKFDAICSY